MKKKKASDSSADSVKQTDTANKKAENKEKSGEKKPRTKSIGEIVRQQRATAALGAKICINWDTHFSTLQVPDVSKLLLEHNANILSNAIDAVYKIAANKQVNTVALKATNKALDVAVSRLKKQLKVLYPTNQLHSVYAAYGLVINHKNMYVLPIDNTERQAKLNLLLNKLQEVGNPILSLPDIGFSHWLQLQSKHSNLWLESENLRQERSNTTQLVRDKYELVLNDIKRVHSYMAFVFDKNELATRRRLMGFLKESI